jgi:PII-like signaling protein
MNINEIVCKGIEGFGARTRINTSHLVDISSDLPVVVELVDSEEYINRYLLEIEGLLNEGMIIMDAVEIIKYSSFEGDRLKRLPKPAD